MKPGNYYLYKKRDRVTIMGEAVVMSDENVMYTLWTGIHSPALNTTVDKLQAKYRMESKVKETSGEKIAKSLQDILDVHRK